MKKKQKIFVMVVALIFFISIGMVQYKQKNDNVGEVKETRCKC